MESEALVKVPCTYYEKVCTQTGECYYLVELYLIITDDFTVYSFLSPNDYHDNVDLAIELKVDFHTHTLLIPVTPYQYSWLFKQIQEYDNVLKSSPCFKPKQKYTFKKH